jgi:tRNA-2-methylthio-N6-dimethylallyladenosine synthase
MNRKYTREKYLEIIKKVREKKPDIALGTDIIVGFSGETDEQFKETVTLYEACDFDIAYTAQYSPRSGTLGFKLFQDDVVRVEKKRRWETLQSLMEKITKQKNQAFVGKTLAVLVERIENGFASGTSAELKLVRFPCTDDRLIGTIVPVGIHQALEWQLNGKQEAVSPEI